MQGSSCSKHAVDEETAEVQNARIRIPDNSVPLVIRSTDPSITPRDLNSRYIGRTLKEVAGEKPVTAWFSNQGSLVVYVKSSEAFNRLKSVTAISGIPVQAELPRWFHRHAGKIRNVSALFSEKCLLELLAEQGVIHVRRQLAHSQRADGTVRVKSTNHVVLHFGPDRPRPRQVKLGLKLYDVHYYSPPPVQCTKCQAFDHVARACTNGYRCKICSGPHAYRICTKRNRVRCANCAGDHKATFAACPAKLREVKRTRMARQREEWERRRELRDQAREDKELENSSQYGRHFYFGQ
ncbi:uncharacterized protein LOC144108302 [Amblyomma americanum]